MLARSSSHHRHRRPSPVRKILRSLVVGAVLMTGLGVSLWLFTRAENSQPAVSGASESLNAGGGQVLSSDAQQIQANSNVDVAVVSADSTPPTIPLNLKVLSADVTNVTLTWDPSVDTESGLQGYRVYRNGELVQRVSEAWLHDSDLQEQTLYTYMVSSIDQAIPPNESLMSKIIVSTQPLFDADK